MFSLFAVVRSTVVKMSFRTRLVLAAMTAVIVSAMTPVLALATETEAEKKVGEAAGKVGTSGEGLILIVLTSLVGLIALYIILPKAIGFIRRFI
jgi:hypothetical protein